jgi:peptide/nickel transport system permease protein
MQKWELLPLRAAWWPPLPGICKKYEQSLPPGSSSRLGSRTVWHGLGTDASGHDLLAAMLHGAGVSALTVLVAGGLVLLIGVAAGALAGYAGDRRLSLSRRGLAAVLAGLPLCAFYAGYVRRFAWQDALKAHAQVPELLIRAGLSAALLAGCALLARMLLRSAWWRRSVRMPVDNLLLRTLELMQALPKLVLLLVIAEAAGSGNKAGYFLVLAAIALLSWDGVARLVRAETRRIMELPYIEAARALGLPPARLWLRHVWPNARANLLVVAVFAAAGILLLESSLSYLQVAGMQDGWGSLLTEARGRTADWRLAIFPGLAICCSVLAFNTVGGHLRRRAAGVPGAPA